jgi:unsaturated chondroitin disaccharide hydrolase
MMVILKRPNAMKLPNPPMEAADLRDAIHRLFEISAGKILSLEAVWRPEDGSPVFTAGGRYASRGWTEWTQGFQFGSALLQFDATGDERFLEIGRRGTVDRMAAHLTHIGVHDHGFNNISTYGNLLRLMDEERVAENAWERRYYELALKCSGAVQAARWTATCDGGFIYSFNGPHSLFVDTIRSLRSLAVAHRLGHVLMGENDRRISLIGRLARHAEATARYNVYYGEGRDIYDVRGRVAHESIFNANDGCYRCPSSQQGYSPFTTWTRGLAWAICGFAEQLEFLSTVSDAELEGRAELIWLMRKAASATADFYIENTAADGIPYWDTGAPGLARLGDWRGRPADPVNEFEPVDSSAAAIAAQGLLRLGRWLESQGEPGGRYWQAGLLTAGTLFREPYLSADPNHHGLILHSIYHRPNGWDSKTSITRCPSGEASMWGDYHARELALYLRRIIEEKPYLTFWSERLK